MQGHRIKEGGSGVICEQTVGKKRAHYRANEYYDESMLEMLEFHISYPYRLVK